MFRVLQNSSTTEIILKLEILSNSHAILKKPPKHQNKTKLTQPNPHAFNSMDRIQRDAIAVSAV